MVLFNYSTKELTAKIVYYGPGLCGKTTNLQFVYENLPPQVKKGKMLSLATKTDRTLFFDFLPLELGRIRGMKTRVQLYTVPGQVFYNSTRKLVLKGADGVVFVADSQQRMMDSNVESYKNLEENLKEIGLRLDEMPLVMQFNKRDLPHLASIEEMNTLINRHNAPFYEAVATTGIGVEDTLKAVTKLVLNHLAAKYQLEAPSISSSVVGKEEPEPLPAPTSRPPTSQPGPVTSAPGLRIDGEIDDVPPPRAVTARPAMADPGDIELEQLEELEPVDETEDLMGGERVEELEDEEIPIVLSPPSPPLAHEQPDAVSATTEDTTSLGQDLTDLLEEIEEPSDEEVLEILEEPIRGAAPAPSAERISASPISLPSPRRPEAPRSSAAAPRPLPPERRASQQEVISPLDPLGLGAGRDGEMPVARAIQVGAVSPGKEHRITVPLEMSVGGRKVRLHLRMTLTVSD